MTFQDEFAKDCVKGLALVELQSFTTKVADGAGIATNIPVAELGLRDTLQSVMQYIAGIPTANLLAEATISEAGNIQLSTTDTTGHKLVVSFFKKP